MNYFKDPSSPLSGLRSRAAAGLALLGAGLVIAGCGSSGDTGTITIGNENTADTSLINQKNPEIPETPKSGPLSTKPTIQPGTPPKPTKLETKDLVVGTGPEAKKGQTVYTNYVGALWSNGKEFDSSWKRNEPFLFVIGTEEVIKGWEKGILGMKVGGRREMIIPAEEAYGKAGNEPKIPPNEPLIFVVDLLKINKAKEG